eukprot:762510-Hanusia_phi.AAC.4
MTFQKRKGHEEQWMKRRDFSLARHRDRVDSQQIVEQRWASFAVQILMQNKLGRLQDTLLSKVTQSGLMAKLSASDVSKEAKDHVEEAVVQPLCRKKREMPSSQRRKLMRLMEQQLDSLSEVLGKVTQVVEVAQKVVHARIRREKLAVTERKI